MGKKRGKGKSKFLEILNSKPVIGALIFIMLSLTTVLAGNVIVKEGSMDIEDNLNASNILFVDVDSGKIGIGKNTPLSMLDIIQPNTDDGGIRLKNTAATAGRYLSIWAGTVGSVIDQKSPDASSGLLFYMNGAEAMRIHSDGNVGIGKAPGYPLEIDGQTSGISLYTSHNISAAGFVTRTTLFDLDKNPWDYIKPASYFRDNGEINHSKFYGYVQWESSDKTRPVMDLNNETTYPYNITEEGVKLDAEIELLRQAVYELKTENDLMGKNLCSLGITEWC